MKILFHHRIASRDGQSVHMDEMIAAFRDLGHEVVLVGPPLHERSAFGGQSRMVAWLKRFLPAAVYEILETGYNIKAYVRLRAAYRAHRPDVIYERYNLYTLAGVWLKKTHGVPLVLEVNAPLAEERTRYGGLSLRRLALWTERAAWRGADYVLPVTEVLAGHVRRAGVPDQCIRVIPNGIDPKRFAHAPSRDEAKRRLGLSGRIVLGFTGFVHDWHGLDRVVDLLAETRSDPPLHLLVVGDGPGWPAVAGKAKARGVEDQVTALGVIGRDAVAECLAAFDVALQPAVTPYASPLKLFEYMVMGGAIVAPDMPNTREILTHGQDALLFDPDRRDDFIRSVRLLCDDPVLRARLGDGAQGTIERKGLKWTVNAERVLALCAQLRTRGTGDAVSVAKAIR